jgi:hypothetical protein
LPWGKYARRVDFLYTSPSEFPFSILYFTGSKGFNTIMREHALSMKYTLNEHGFSAMDGKKKGARIDRVFPDEKSIFEFLKLEYKSPEERLDGRAIEPIRPVMEPVMEPVVEPVVESVVEPVVKASTESPDENTGIPSHNNLEDATTPSRVFIKKQNSRSMRSNYCNIC